MASMLKIMVFILLVLGSYSTISLALTNDRIIVESSNGLAISGYDPVSYHLDEAPRLGDKNIETVWRGVIWTFATPTNQAAFIDNPEYYTPAFGGYDPTSVAEGRLTSGNPLIWAKNDEKIYFFFSAKKRDLFMSNPEIYVNKSEEIWPELN